jgi:ferredoxin
MYKVDKEKCLGCAGCTVICPNGIELGDDNKAQIIDQEEIEKAGGEDICPYGAIIKQDD